MKRIACIGTIQRAADGSASESILEVYNGLRVYNAQHAVTGLFIGFQQQVLQVMEGAAEEVALSLYKTRQSKLLSDLVVINDLLIEQPQFTSWRAKFYHPDMANHRVYLQKLKEQLLPDSSLVAGDATVRAQQFWSMALPATVAGAAPKALEHDDLLSHLFHITAWPRQSRISLTPRLIRLCTVLSNGWVSYADLWSTGLFKHEQELDSTLQQLMALDVLVMKDSALTTATNPVPATPAAVESASARSGEDERFGSLMRKFLFMKRKEQANS